MQFFYLEVYRLLCRSRPFPRQRRRSDLLVSLAPARHVEVWQLRLRSQGVKFFPVTREYSRIASSTSRKVWTASPRWRRLSLIQSRRSVRFRDHSACAACSCFDCLVVTLALFVEVRASQHGEQVVRPRKRKGIHQGIHQGATNEHCYARHYFRISAGMSPRLLSISLVAMARATPTTTMPTSRGVKSSFGGLPPIAISPSRAYPAARPETTALLYSALTSILPSVAGVGVVLFHIVGVGASLQLGRFIMDFGRGACRHRRGIGAQAHNSRDIRKWTPS